MLTCQKPFSHSQRLNLLVKKEEEVILILVFLEGKVEKTTIE